MSKMMRSHNKNQNIPSEPEEMFSALRLFDGVSKREKRVLLSSVKKTMFAPGVILFKKNDKPKNLWIVFDGIIHLRSPHPEKKENITVMSMITGDFLLPAAVVTRQPYLLEAYCASAATMLQIDANIIDVLCSLHSSFARIMLEYVAKQFRNYINQTSCYYHCSGSQRLFCYLVKLSIIQDNRKKVVLPHSKSLVAAELHMTPENLSRIITRFRGEIFEINGSEIVILNYAQLISLCGHIRA